VDILHVIPQSVYLEELRFHGSTKDIKCRTELFAELGLSVQEMVVTRNDDEVVDLFKAKQLKNFRVVLIDGPGIYPKTLGYIKKAYPDIMAIYRSHNPEFFHRMDWMIAEKTIGKKLVRLQRAFRGLFRDMKSIFHADYVLPISDWDSMHYWRFLGNAKKVITVPYFLPKEYVNEVEHVPSKETLCVSFSAIQATPLMADAIHNFSHLVTMLGDRCNNWKFSIVGNPCDVNVGSPRIETMGILGNPFEVLDRARAVAILSDYGRGFKTKIMEAIHSRAYVMVTPALFKRLPHEVRPFCLSVRKKSIRDFQQALEYCLNPYPAYDPNLQLRTRALNAMSCLKNKEM